MSTRKPPIKTRTLNESDWINNFWFIDDYLYVTDSSFDSKTKSLLGRIKVDHVIENLKDKKNFDRTFILSPNPVVSGALNAQNSDIEVVNYYKGFIYNVFKFKDLLYVSIIKDDQSSRVIVINSKNKAKTIKEYNDLLVVGELNDQLVLKSVKDRQTFIDGKPTKIGHIKRICYTEDNYIILCDDNHLHTLKKGTWEFKTIKDNDKEINICNFDKSAYVISDKEAKLTYIINKMNEKEDIYHNYFYRLDCYNKLLLIGKPLFMDDDLVESYTLPLTFID